MATSGNIAAEQLRSFIERLETLEEEKMNTQTLIKEVFAEAKGQGFDPKIMRQVMKLRKMEQEERQEQEHLLDLYCHALGLEAESAPAKAA
jgi:uncharacterized protein (UPF0335 family)